MLEYWRIKLRKFKWDDLYAVQALLNMIAEDEDDPYFYNLEWLHYVLNQSEVNAEENCFVATVYGGKVVGYSRVESGNNPSQVRVFAGTHPNMTGIGVGRALVTVNDFNLLATHPPDTSLTVIRRTPCEQALSASLLTRAGYHQTGTDEDDYLLWEKRLR